MYTEVIMPLQTNLTMKTNELNMAINTFWPTTPNQNKFRQIMQDKNSNKKRRHFSEQQLKQQNKNSVMKTPTTPNTLSNINNKLQIESSPFYAGAKFSEAPLPSFLPKPPVAWLPSEMNQLTDELSALSNDLKAAVTTMAVITEKKIQILEKNQNDKIEKTNETSGYIKQNHNQTPSSKYYAERKRTDSSSSSSLSGAALNSLQYNFRNMRRHTPQCQTKCKNGRYSSFSRQNIHQKIAAVN